VLEPLPEICTIFDGSKNEDAEMIARIAPKAPVPTTAKAFHTAQPSIITKPG